nr:hypothetical protein [Deinococcus alpinitundrae]
MSLPAETLQGLFLRSLIPGTCGGLYVLIPAASGIYTMLSVFISCAVTGKPMRPETVAILIACVTMLTVHTGRGTLSQGERSRYHLGRRRDGLHLHLLAGFGRQYDQLVVECFGPCAQAFDGHTGGRARFSLADGLWMQPRRSCDGLGRETPLLTGGAQRGYKIHAGAGCGGVSVYEADLHSELFSDTFARLEVNETVAE